MPTHFLIQAGRVLPEVERIIEANDRYVVVQKIGAGEQIAAAFDPRS